jgi:hypothetical protein
VPILPASDAGYYYVAHGLGLDLELARLEALGFSPLELLTLATAGNAAAIGRPDRGRVAAGLRADLLVLDDDPTASVDALAAPALVVRAGVAWTRDELVDVDPLLEPADADLDAFCLDARDCRSSSCDRVRHRCVPACADGCGPEGWCAPADGLDAEPVCRSARTCELYAPTCAPPPYREACVPLDLDTSGCFPAGPRADGDACDPYDLDTSCGPGLVCTLDDGRCHVPCPPGSDGCAHGSCEVIRAAGTPWFGVCR